MISGPGAEVVNRARAETEYGIDVRIKSAIESGLKKDQEGNRYQTANTINSKFDFIKDTIEELINSPCGLSRERITHRHAIYWKKQHNVCWAKNPFLDLSRTVLLTKEISRDSCACVRINGVYTDWFDIRRGVRQGCDSITKQNRYWNREWDRIDGIDSVIVIRSSTKIEMKIEARIEATVFVGALSIFPNTHQYLIRRRRPPPPAARTGHADPARYPYSAAGAAPEQCDETTSRRGVQIAFGREPKAVASRRGRDRYLVYSLNKQNLINQTNPTMK
ncbi:hypothetical protein EVAR_12744_1 [Eumeta japonica]|uniref:Uncharacterized protein n=1 Tax=Eumeta variegata TaxID=151549 RepID=A0A4C1UNT0_EUMVA|nr:hypothetical protein EVAR_12744_1 [Eumeta japonica]